MSEAIVRWTGCIDTDVKLQFSRFSDIRVAYTSTLALN